MENAQETNRNRNKKLKIQIWESHIYKTVVEPILEPPK